MLASAYFVCVHNNDAVLSNILFKFSPHMRHVLTSQSVVLKDGAVYNSVSAGSVHTIPHGCEPEIK